MKANEIRQKFLDFFKEKEHQIVDSAPLVVKDDPTLMFTNAGMNQFKDYFLGNKKSPSPRIADTQKCLRVSGKHNDLEEVGIDTYHHTMFEMLGNWSFGEYFKKEAIEWAWELLTKEYGLSEERLYATVFGGDKEDGLARDEEAFELWRRYLPAERILDGSKKDNFWEMGDTGPCGPCSEIHIDLRSDEERKKTDGGKLVNADHPQVIEIWNLVFIQYNRKANGSLETLPAQHVDTGMGFERLAMAIQGKTSNYDTDVFSPLIDKVSELSGVKYKADEKTDIAIRVIVDHVRAVTFAIADGQLPSNTGAGYVIRRILRRAVRYGFNYLNLTRPFIFELVETISSHMGHVFKEVPQQKDFIANVIKEEEAAFLRTLENGLKIFEEALSKAQKDNQDKPMISGEVAFKLYDTFGFPIDLTELLAREKSASIDLDGFAKCMQEQKDRSKSAAESVAGDWITVSEGNEPMFVGYDQLTSTSKILRYREVTEKKQKLYQVVLNVTPFYAESGGQVGDTGTLKSSKETIKVIDTQKENNLIIHYVDKLPAQLDAEFDAQVDANKRTLTENNHSCTHLLHAALRQVLGTHVAQKGSLVNDKILRFDFSHFSKMTDEEIAKVEEIVNTKIRENVSLDERRNVPINEAKGLGAMALFGEKYGDQVRVIIFDKNYSIELCGGTHVKATGNIGLFKIIAESSVAAGVRRIEAVTGVNALNYYNEQLQLLNEVREILKNPKDLIKYTSGLLDEKNELSKKIEKFELEKVKGVKESLINSKTQVNGIQSIVAQVEVPDANALKKLGFELKNEVKNVVMVLAANIDGKPMIAIAIDDELVKSKGLHAGNKVRELAKLVNGGGGGQPFFATAGGSDISGLPQVVSQANEWIQNLG